MPILRRETNKVTVPTVVDYNSFLQVEILGSVIAYNCKISLRITVTELNINCAHLCQDAIHNTASNWKSFSDHLQTTTQGGPH